MAVLDFSNSPTQHRYAWAWDPFHYLTVQSPQDDYLPDTTRRNGTSR